MRRLALLISALSLFAVPATANAATAGGLKQLSGTAGCIVDEASPPTGCKDVRGMTDVGKMAASPDGRNVYVPSRGRGAIAVFTRNSDGSLTQKAGALGCYTSDSTVATQDQCTLVGTGLTGVFAVTVSPNGQNLYAGNSSGAPVRFTRNSSGDLTYVTTGLSLGGNITQIAVSPDNNTVYTSNLTQAAGQTGGLIGVYQADLGYHQCWASVGTSYGCVLTTNGYVDEPGDLFVTPDNKQLILANGENTGTDYSSGSVVGFARTTAAGSTQGNLTAPTTASCITGNTTISGCQTRSGAFYMRGLSALSNTEFYAASYYGVFRVIRNAATNALSISGASNACASASGIGFSCGVLNSNSNRVFNHRDVLVSGDGKNVYSENENGTSSTILSFSRGSDGSFTPLPDPLTCLSVDGGAGCSAQLAGGGPTNNLVAVGNSVYAAGGNRLFSFRRDRAPVCSNVSARTAFNTAVTVTLGCSDPDGDPVSYQKVTDPGRGTLGGIQGNRVSYGPQVGTSGTDSFQYRAVSGGAASDVATAFVSVAAPTGGGGGGGTPTTVVPSTTSINSLAFPKFTKLLALKVKNLQAGSTVLVTCKTKKKKQQKKGCAYKKKRFTTTGARARLDLRKPFKKKKIPVGTKITITITAPGFLGKRITYTTRKGKLPKSKVQCLSASGRAGSCA
jgi:Bacterial Ig domain